MHTYNAFMAVYWLQYRLQNHYNTWNRQLQKRKLPLLRRRRATVTSQSQLVGHMALTSKFVDCCSEKYPEKSQKKQVSSAFFDIWNKARKSHISSGFFGLWKKDTHFKTARFSQSGFKKAKLASLTQSVLTPVSSQSIPKRKNGLGTWNILN